MSATPHATHARRRIAAAFASVVAIALLVTASPASGSPASPGLTGFKANSITWTSPHRGWMLGTAPCGTGTCSEVIATTDGGRAWRPLGAIQAPIARLGDALHPGITEIRFATPSMGWAFGPYMFRTTDGGRSWAPTPIPGSGKQVLDLAAGPSGTYALVSPCRWAMGLCGGGQLSLWRTSTPAGTSWTRVSLDLPINVAADVAAYGRTVYVVDSQVNVNGGSDRFYASADGRTFSPRPVPCDQTPDIALTQVVPTSPTDVALLCDGNPGFSKADKFVYRSTNTGKTDEYAGTMDQPGIQAQLAASPSGNLAVASWSDGSFIYVNDTPTSTAWTMEVAYSDGGAGWNDIAYVTGREAWVVYAPADSFPGLGKVFVTRDAGNHWYLADPSSGT